MFRQLVASGLLATDDDGFGVLRLTAASRGVLRGETPVQLRRVADRAERRASRAQRASEVTRHESGDRAARRRRCGRRCATLRARLAREQGVPAYVIFHDATLLQMLRERPRRCDELGAISGVGAAKLARYGEAFLRRCGSDA